MSLATCRVTEGSLNNSQLTHLKRIQRFADQRDRLLDSGLLSVPSKLGQLVITVSSKFDTTRVSDARKQEFYAAFMEEAERLQEERLRAKSYAGILIRQKADVVQIQSDLGNPEISDMVFIGEGNIARFNTDAGGNDIGWSQAAEATTYLKQGRIEQRMCGHYPRVRFVEVPLGTFAVSQYSNVSAAIGQLVPDINPDDGMFQPVFSNESPPIVDQIIDLDARYPRRLD